MRYLDQILGPTRNAITWLTEHLRDANEFHARVGYLDRRGVGLSYVEQELRALLDRGGQAYIVVDYRDGNPRRGDLTWLLEFFAPYGDRATVRLANDVAAMHAKVFYVREASGDRHALVGSANFTGAGMLRNYEAGIAIEPGDTEVLDDIEQANKAWLEKSQPVDLGAVNALEQLGTGSPTGQSARIGELLQPTLNMIEAAGSAPYGLTGLSTGITDLDRLLNGLGAGQLVLVAGRTSMGKTTLASDFMRSVSIRHEIPSLMLSFEMPKEEIMQRLLSAEARLPLHLLRSGQLNDDDWTKLARRMGEIQDSPLHINASCSTSIRNVAAEIRRAVVEDRVRLVVVDFIQHLQADRRMENRQQEITEIARTFKRLALELDIAIVVVSQLNRAPEHRPDKRPVLSDLRDSGTLEEAADVVILLHRDDYYDPNSPRAGEADIIVAKHRSGPTDVVTVAAQLHYSRFVEMAEV